MKSLAALVVVASLLIVPSPARATSSPTFTPAAPSSASDAIFLSQLGTPPPVLLSGCSVSLRCQCLHDKNYVISCAGMTTCAVVPVGPPGHTLGGVECDGVIEDVCPGPENC